MPKWDNLQVICLLLTLQPLFLSQVFRVDLEGTRCPQSALVKTRKRGEPSSSPRSHMIRKALQGRAGGGGHRGESERRPQASPDNVSEHSAAALRRGFQAEWESLLAVHGRGPRPPDARGSPDPCGGHPRPCGGRREDRGKPVQSSRRSFLRIFPGPQGPQKVTTAQNPPA